MSVLPAGMQFAPGPINGVLLEGEEGRASVYGWPDRLDGAGDLLLTHARRDAVWGAPAMAAAGWRVWAPAGEAELLADPGAFWRAFERARLHDYTQVSSRVLAAPMPVHRSVRGGERFSAAGASVEALATPGYTPGAVSYVVRTGGLTVGFPGDLICSDGRIPDLYSLQDSIPEAGVGGYHGCVGRLGALLASLDRLAAAGPDLLIPCRGAPIPDPVEAIGRLIRRARSFYANYLAIDAHRYYSAPGPFQSKVERVLGAGAVVEARVAAETRDGMPAWLIAVDTSRIIVSEGGAALVIDCGSARVVEHLRQMRDGGQIHGVDALFISHYHDDHTDFAASLAAEFGCAVVASTVCQDVLERPADHRLPCLTTAPVTVTHPVASGTGWRWREFGLRLFYFPGQALLHDALLVESADGERVFFIGDSFTPTGIDDYCMQNRNLLGNGLGYDRCLMTLEADVGCDAWLINQHVAPAFRFSPVQVAAMRRTLAKRVELVADLSAWDGANFATDEGWARFDPYALRVRAGERARAVLRIANHGPRTATFGVTLDAPADWRAVGGEIRVRSGDAGALPVWLHVPDDALAGLAVVTADIAFGGRELRAWTEMLVRVSAGDEMDAEQD